MAIPTSIPWDIADFNSATMSAFLGLPMGDLTVVGTAFSYSASTNLLTATSSGGATSYADFHVAMPGEFTLDFVFRLPQLPHDAADLLDHHIGLQLADDGGRGFSLYFSQTGIAIARIDDFGSVSSLPDSTVYTAEITRYFHRVRVVVNSGLGRAYVFIGRETDPFPALRFIVPVEATPVGVSDRFRITLRGASDQPVQMEFRTLQLAGSLQLPNLPPVANGGGDKVISAGNTARLDGRSSYDPEGAELSYYWRAVDAPFNSTFAYDASNGSTTDDGDVDGFTHVLSFAAGSLPDWVIPGDVVLLAGGRHIIAVVDDLGGTLTVATDTLPDNLTSTLFRIIRQSLLVEAATPTPAVVPDIPGLYRFVLVVNDGEIDSEDAEVLVSVVGARAPLGIEPSVEVLWDGLGDEWRFVANKEIFTEFWRGTTQILGAKLLEVWQHHYNMSLKDTQRVFQRKWVGFRTLINETLPDFAVIRPRYGKLEATHIFSLGNPAVTGATLVFELPETDGTFKQYPVTLTGVTAAVIAGNINLAMGNVGYGLDIIGYVTSDGFLGVKSTTLGFRLGISSSAAALLGFSIATYNYCSGVRGAAATGYTYRVDTGTDLNDYEITQGDLLVLNNGQAFRIERVLNDPRDGAGGQRLLLRDPLPLDASPEWAIPSVLISYETNYELAGAYPGDLVKVEAFNSNTSAFADCTGLIVAEFEQTIAANFDALYAYLRDPSYELRWLGVKRRKSVALPADVISVPRLQDLIPKDATPSIWTENIDYVLEPFFRDDLQRPIPQLQFADSVFIDPNLEPPDVLWAELVLFSNDQNIEDLFGRLVGFLREDAQDLGEGFSYLSGVSGLMYAMQRGPTPYAMRVGTQILFGQPFAEVAGYVTEIRDDYSPLRGRILVQDDDGSIPSASEIIRSYTYRKDPLDLTHTSGLDLNATTSLPHAVGNRIEQFAPIGAGVSIEDYVNSPGWFNPFVTSGVFSELEKFFYFAVRFNLDLVSLANLTLINQFIYRIKPTYTYPILLGTKYLADDVDLTDSVEFVGGHGEYSPPGGVVYQLYDAFKGEAELGIGPPIPPGSHPAHSPEVQLAGDYSLGNPKGMGRAFILDDYRGNGAVWAHLDGVDAAGNPDPDGLAVVSGIIDVPQDYTEFTIIQWWGGGPIDSGNFYFLAYYPTEVIVLGEILGGIFVPTGIPFYVPAPTTLLDVGYYAYVRVTDLGNQVMPPVEWHGP